MLFRSSSTCGRVEKSVGISRSIWAPFGMRPPVGVFTVTDEMIASLLAEPSPPPRQQRRLPLLPLIPLIHGFGALTTFLLTVTAALLPVR